MENLRKYIVINGYNVAWQGGRLKFLEVDSIKYNDNGM